MSVEPRAPLSELLFASAAARGFDAGFLLLLVAFLAIAILPLLDAWTLNSPDASRLPVLWSTDLLY
jgi:hypothetical protein